MWIHDVENLERGTAQFWVEKRRRERMKLKIMGLKHQKEVERQDWNF